MGCFEFLRVARGQGGGRRRAAAVFLLAWPPALPWIAAAALLQFGVRHLALAFKEVDRDETSAHAHRTHAAGGVPSLPSPDDGERRLDWRSRWRCSCSITAGLS